MNEIQSDVLIFQSLGKVTETTSRMKEQDFKLT